MSIFPSHWHVQHPDRLQLYSMTTQNGLKPVVFLEEVGLPYEAHRVDIGKGEQFEPSYLELNPNNKIPSLIDPEGPGGRPVQIMESGAILHYLAHKTGQLVPADPIRANEVLQWMFFQVGSVGPMFGQYGHFLNSAPKEQDHAYALKRYTDESLRILGVLEGRLEGREWLVDDYSVADVMIGPWIFGLSYYGGPVHEALSDHPRISAYLERFGARPAVQRALEVYG